VALVRRAEAEARADPAAYRRRVLRLALQGCLNLYGGLLLLAGFVIALPVAAIAGGSVDRLAPLGYVWVPALIILVTALEALARARRVELAGIEVHRSEYPRLFALVDEVSATLGVSVRRVLIRGDVGALVTHVPMPTLTLGLPLLEVLTPAQCRAVVAHELAHLARRHGDDLAWALRLHGRWSLVAAGLERRRHWARFVFSSFYRDYIPRFTASIRGQLHQHEIEADALAVRVAGKEAHAAALAKTVVTAAFVQDRFWPTMYASAEVQREPPNGVFERQAEALAAPRPAEADAQALRVELTRSPAADDYHPTLAERVRPALGEADLAALLTMARAAEPGAAAQLLGERRAQLVAQVSAAWRPLVAAVWTGQHQARKQARVELEALEAVRQDPDVTGLWRKAQLVGILSGGAAAVPILKDVLARAPHHPGANLGLGAELLRGGDERGLEHLERAMNADGRLVAAACARAERFLLERGDAAAATQYRTRALRNATTIIEARREREHVTEGDHFVPHALGTEQVDALRVQLARQALVRRAYYVRKQLRHLPEVPQFVLAVDLVLPWHRFLSRARVRSALQQIAGGVRWPGPTRVICLNQQVGSFADRLRAVAGAAIYARGDVENEARGR